MSSNKFKKSFSNIISFLLKLRSYYSHISTISYLL